MSDGLRSVEAHRDDVLAAVEPLSPLSLQLLDAHGCFLAEDVAAGAPLPRFDNSAMDGYAVRAGDLAGAGEATPVVLPVVGDIPAGSRAAHQVREGVCVRIMTGAPVPAGADAVVPQEWTDGGLDRVTVHRAPAVGENVRRAGEDVALGTPVLAAGTMLGAAQIGLLAALGRDRVLARPRPRVVVLSTGSELVEPGAEVAEGQITDANSYLLTLAAREAGAIAYRVGIVADDPTLLMDTLQDQLIRADVVVTSGGVSVGAFDVVKQVLSGLGTVRFVRVAMQPGMPQGFGTLGPEQVPFFGLPGNPVSAYVSFEVFVRPALRRLLGAGQLLRPTVRARTGAVLRSPAGRRSFLRGRYADGEVVPVGGSGSHLIGALAAANALVEVPEEVTELPAGAEVDVHLMERRHG